MKKVTAMMFLFALTLQLTACSGQENVSGTTEATESVENVSDTSEAMKSVENISAEETASIAETNSSAGTKENVESDTVSEELTIDTLFALCESGALAEKAETEGLDGFLQYENLVQADTGDAASLTGTYSCSLSYSYKASDGQTEDRVYAFHLYYWNPATAKEYGHEENEIDMILLTEEATKDAVALYRSGGSAASAEVLSAFLEKDYGVEQYLSVSFPEGFALGSYVADMAFFSGWPLEGDTEEPPHGEGADKSWYAPGGIGRAENASEVLTFEDGVLVDATVRMNHSEILSGGETIDGCAVPAVLMEYGFDLFTVTEWSAYLEKNPDADDSACVSRYWYVFMGEEDTDTYYVLFLDEALFSKEDAIQTARSIRFADGAF